MIMFPVRILVYIKRLIKSSRDIGGKGCIRMLSIGVSRVLIMSVLCESRLEIRRRRLCFQFQLRVHSIE